MSDDDLSPAEWKETIVDQAESQAEWRDEKAEEYSDDSRNEQAATSPRALAENLKALPEDNLAWTRVQRAWAPLDPSIAGEIDQDIFRQYGFGGEPEDECDAGKFLAAYAIALEEASGTVPVTPPRRAR